MVPVVPMRVPQVVGVGTGQAKGGNDGADGWLAFYLENCVISRSLSRFGAATNAASGSRRRRESIGLLDGDLLPESCELLAVSSAAN